MPASIFNAGAVKILKSILRFKDSNVEIITDVTTDPTVSAYDAPQGSILIQSGTGDAFLKKDNGATTNWEMLSTMVDLAQYIPLTQKGANLGVATLDAGGKIPVGQLPSSVMTYEGTWNASTNTPTLVDGVGDAGMVYLVSTAGTTNFGSGPVTFALGDWAVYSGAVWEKSLNSSAVVSVNGQTGVVVLDTDDVAEASNLYFTDSRAKTASVADSITDGITDVAPSQNAVFDALATKQNTITVLPVANGGTGQSTEIAAFNALSPLTTKGDILTNDGTNDIRVPVGTRGTVPTAYDGAPGGIAYLRPSVQYILNPGAEVDTVGWATYKDAAGSVPVDGTGGSPTLTLTRTTSNPLSGQASFLVTKTAANLQGEGASYDFTIDRADRGQMLEIRADLEVVSGTYDSGSSSANSDLIAYIYDVTNSRLIEPAGMKLQAGLKLKATFQTSSDSVSYRLIIHQSLTGTSAYTLALDNFSVGPQVTASGYAGEDLKEFPMVLAATTTAPTVGGGIAINRAMRGRRGDMLIGTWDYHHTTAGGIGSGTYLYNLPAGLVADTTKKNALGSTVPAIVGYASLFDGTNTYSGWVVLYNSTQMSIIAGNQTSGYAAIGSTYLPFNTTQIRISINFEVPIVGWSSNTVASSETDTRTTDAKAYKAATQTGINPNNTAVKMTLDTASFDSHGGFDFANSRYVVKVPGPLDIRGTINIVGTNILNNVYQPWVYKNGSLFKIGQSIVANAGSSLGLVVTTSDNAKIGDYYELFLYGQGNNSSSTLTSTGFEYGTTLEVNRHSGPAQITASEDVTCRYSTASSQAITTTGTVILYGTKAWDSHGAYNTSTGTFTAPVSGEYAIKNMFFTGAATASVIGGYVTTKAVVNGAHQGNLAVSIAKTVSPVFQSAGGGGSVMMKAGDTLQIQSEPSGAGTVTLVGSANVNWVEIRRVGNYA